jgi:hypothetical protein
MDSLILVEGGIIILFGVAYVVQNNRPVTPVLAGSIGILFLVSLLEAFGGNIARVGKALLTLTTFTVVIAEGGSFFTGLQSAINKRG